jgi:hypothetical protein
LYSAKLFSNLRTYTENVLKDGKFKKVASGIIFIKILFRVLHI